MATAKQKAAAKRNIKKASAARRGKTKGNQNSASKQEAKNGNNRENE